MTEADFNLESFNETANLIRQRISYQELEAKVLKLEAENKQLLDDLETIERFVKSVHKNFKPGRY